MAARRFSLSAMGKQSRLTAIRPSLMTGMFSIMGVSSSILDNQTVYLYGLATYNKGYHPGWRKSIKMRFFNRFSTILNKSEAPGCGFRRKQPQDMVTPQNGIKNDRKTCCKTKKKQVQYPAEIIYAKAHH
jgi:hypothetical protein